MSKLKIPLYITEENFIAATVTILAPHVYGIIEFILDTGSQETFISEGDSLRLSIPFKGSPDKYSYGIGGSPIALYEISNLRMNFKTEENKPFTISFPKIHVSKRTSQDERTRNIALSAPSILGNDFLINNKLSFYVNFLKKCAYFEKEENDQ